MTSDQRFTPAQWQQGAPLRVMILASVVSVLLTGVKFAAYLLTGSTGILSDALESIINVVASGFALYSVYLSDRPPDFRHPYGHGKIEYFSVGFEGALIILAAGAILYQAVPAILIKRRLAELDRGILLIVGAAAVNLILGLFLIHVGRRARSLPLVADGRHLLTDVCTSVGVVVGLVLVRLSGRQWWDPLVACLVAINILSMGWRLLRDSFGKLMDEADPELLERIVGIINKNRRPDWVNVHQLRARRYGQQVLVDFHLILPRSYGILEAHDQAKEVEKIILDSMPEVSEVTVHMDPCEDPLCRQCRQHGCEDRSLDHTDVQEPWRLEDMSSRSQVPDGGDNH